MLRLLRLAIKALRVRAVERRAARTLTLPHDDIARLADDGHRRAHRVTQERKEQKRCE